jgi:hypothetical protein
MMKRMRKKKLSWVSHFCVVYAISSESSQNLTAMVHGMLPCLAKSHIDSPY